MNSSDTLGEAASWFIELQSADRREEVWKEFTDWFQASRAHRAAYAKVRRHWIKLTGLPMPPMLPIQKIESPKFASAWVEYWELIIAVLLALLVTYNNQ